MSMPAAQAAGGHAARTQEQTAGRSVCRRARWAKAALKCWPSDVRKEGTV